MRVERSAEILEQLKEATALRTTLIDALTQALGDGSEAKGKLKEPKHSLIQTLELSAEGFNPVLVPVPVSELDRTVSMLAGPFFTSAENPIPTKPKGMLLPVFQLDLREIRTLSGHDLGDGLLQLWCDPDWRNTDRGMVFVIPREEVDTQIITPFDYVAHRGVDSSPLPDSLKFDASSNHVNVIAGYESVGVQCQTSYLEVYASEVAEEVMESVADDFQRFYRLTESNSDLHVLGSFYPIQYSAVDVGWNCLIHFPTWGSSGNAQVFYLLKERGMAFRFDESLS